MTTSTITLTGTDKQIAWATEIRTSTLATFAQNKVKYSADYDKYLAKYGPDRPYVAGIARSIVAIDEIVTILGDIDSAAWWIENRKGGYWWIAGNADETLTLLKQQMAA